MTMPLVDLAMSGFMFAVIMGEKAEVVQDVHAGPAAFVLICATEVLLHVS